MPKQMTVEEVLRSTSNEGLLSTFASLTHRLHAREAESLDAADLRARRDRVQQEIIRRMRPQGPAPIDASLCREAGKHVFGQTGHGADYCPLNQ